MTKYLKKKRTMRYDKVCLLFCLFLLVNHNGNYSEGNLR